jgi:2-amino-4-hydroxy-6-hydroxymethyldihydropteridine diphosphokinase
MNDHSPPCTAWIALGANLGDRAATIAMAIREIDRLPETRVTIQSSLYETDPVGPQDQPDYVNAVVGVLTRRGPMRLLQDLLAIERHHGRDRSRSIRWGARTLDLDLLMYGDLVIDEPGLTLPHPRMHERAFVLAPLCEAAPGLLHPVLKRSMRELLREVRGESKPRLHCPTSEAASAAPQLMGFCQP